jgi:hypothetical protein
MSVSGISSAGGVSPSNMATKIMKDIDANGDGSVDKAEFTKAMASHGVSEADAAKKFDSIDTKKTGKITQSDIEADIKNNVKAGGGAPDGPPPNGPPPGGASKAGGASQTSTTSYDVKDTNKDGSVSAMEALVYEIKHASQSTSKTSEVDSNEATKSSANTKIGSNVDVTV